MKTWKSTKESIWQRKSTWIAAIALLFVAAATSVPAWAQQDVVKESFSVDEGGTLYLDIDWGNVEIETGSGETVRITMERELRGASDEVLKEALSYHEYYFGRDGDDVVIESEYERDDNDRAWRRWREDNNLKITFYVSVPSSYNVDFDSGAGNVYIDDLDGEIEGRTGAGNITIGDTEGSVDVTSGAGNITVEGALGDIYVHSGAGNVILEDVRGEITAGTGAGNIEATITRELYGDSSFNTGAGNVTVYLDENIGADIDARSSLGSARSDYNLRVKGKWLSKSFSGEVNGGGPEIELSAGVGNVTLRRY